MISISPFTPHLDKAECDITDGLIRVQTASQKYCPQGKGREESTSDFPGSGCLEYLDGENTCTGILETPSELLENTYNEIFK